MSRWLRVCMLNCTCSCLLCVQPKQEKQSQKSTSLRILSSTLRQTSSTCPSLLISFEYLKWRNLFIIMTFFVQATNRLLFSLFVMSLLNI